MKPPSQSLMPILRLLSYGFDICLQVLVALWVLLRSFFWPIMEINDPAAWSQACTLVEVFTGEVGEEHGGQLWISKQPISGLFRTDYEVLSNRDRSLK
jgi:hypothetical protein